MRDSTLNPKQSIGHQLSLTLRSISTDMDTRQTRLGLSHYEWLVIGTLLKAEKGHATQAEIREHLGIEESYLTKVLDKLITRKLISKVICDKDRRHRKLNINPDAMPFIKKVTDEIIHANKKYLQGFSKDELEQLFSFLARVRDNAEKAHI